MAVLDWPAPRTLAAALGAAGAILVACGGGDDPTPSATAPIATPTAEATATPGSDGDGRVAEVGDSVQVHYRGTLDDGQEFDTSRGGDPLPFVVGSGRMIAGFDAAVRGMAVGDTLTARLEPTEAYGEVDPARILEFPIAQAPEGLEVGDQVSVSGASAIVTAITQDTVTVDANHELAGKALTFEIELVSIE